MSIFLYQHTEANIMFLSSLSVSWAISLSKICPILLYFSQKISASNYMENLIVRKECYEQLFTLY